MSAVAALVAPHAAAAGHVPRMLGAAVAPYAADSADVHRRAAGQGHAALGAHAAGWELPLVGAPLASDGGVVVVADAALYGGAAPRATPGGPLHAPRDRVAACQILAAYAAYGDRLAEHLCGDYAFVVWDAARGVVVAARDFMGRRPLYVARVPDGVALASHPRMLLAHPSVASAVDVAHVAGRAAGLLEAPDTAYASIAELRPGHTLVARAGRDGVVAEPVVRRHWVPPTFERADGRPFDEAADTLRDALERATLERLAPSGASAVWLSGGHDSTAVYAAGQAGLRARGDVRVLRAVSMRYPPGDPGGEDERIAAVADRWDGDVTWQDVDEVPLFGGGDDVARRAGPFAHAFERWMSALAGRAVARGAPVVLDGSGGDQLFQVSPVYVADLVGRGRLREARAQLRTLGIARAGWRAVARTAVLPLLPAAAWPAMAALRGGRPVRGLRAGRIPPWIREPWRRRLADRAEVALERRRGESLAALESRWYFETTYAGSVFAEQTAIVRATGAEMRSPLYDDRIVTLAAARPRVERAHHGETKCLLRAAHRDRLPAVVLAPRTRRSGTTDAYFRRRMERELPGIVSRVLSRPALADLGVLEPALLAAAVEQYLQANDAEAGAAIFATVQAERWLRARG